MGKDAGHPADSRPDSPLSQGGGGGGGGGGKPGTTQVVDWEYDMDGYDKDGYDANGYDMAGCDPDGNTDGPDGFAERKAARLAQEPPISDVGPWRMAGIEIIAAGCKHLRSRQKGSGFEECPGCGARRTFGSSSWA